MNPSRARAEVRLLAALLLTFTAAFYATAAWLILTVASSWGPRTVVLALTAAIALGSVLLVRSAWRHSLTLPLPSGAANSWLVRQRWWVLTLIWLAALTLPGLVMALVAYSRHMRLPLGFLVLWLVASVAAAACLAAAQRVNWHLRSENSAN